jgi:DnaJ-class molecular chaperone
MSGKIICPHCNGNGFIRDEKSHPDVRKQEVIQCKKCDSQGEVDITEDVLRDLQNMTRLQ